jgi:acyl-CoA synthetase (AMP-forming)/AMP-acid ligase II
MNVLSILSDMARRHPDRPALILGKESITFSALRERIDRASAGLQREGLNPGDRAIVMIPMSIDLYVAMLALLDLGAIAVFVDPWIGWRHIASFAAYAEPRAWLGIPRSHLLRLLAGRIPITVTTSRRLGPFPARRTLSEIEEPEGDGAVHASQPDDPALITFTSGSSGEPKGANRTHRFLLAQHEALATEFPAQEGDVDMPMFPVFALNNLALGVPSVVPAMDFRRVDRVDGAAILRQMREHRVTTCTASPPFFDRLAATGEDPGLRRLLTGGAPVSDAQLRAWRKAFPKTGVLVAYGSTEAEPVAHLTAKERLELKGPGFCAGKPIDRIRARLIDEQGRGLPPGEIGELVVAGDHVCRDYYRNPKAVKENKIVDADGTVWHRMGDTGYFDAEGRFWIVGRVHSTIRRGGELIHPQLVEQAARGEDPRIRRIAAVGVEERVVLVIETDAEEEIEKDILARLAAAGHAVDEIRLTREPLPVDPRHNSKIDYGRLRARLGGGSRPGRAKPV